MTKVAKFIHIWSCVLAGVVPFITIGLGAVGLAD